MGTGQGPWGKVLALGALHGVWAQTSTLEAKATLPKGAENLQNSVKMARQETVPSILKIILASAS